jgi:hypothetical protein
MVGNVRIGVKSVSHEIYSAEQVLPLPKPEFNGSFGTHRHALTTHNFRLWAADMPTNVTPRRLGKHLFDERLKQAE